MGIGVAGDYFFKRPGAQAFDYLHRTMTFRRRRTEKTDRRIESSFQSGNNAEASRRLNGLFRHSLVDPENWEIVNGASHRNCRANGRASHQDSACTGLVGGTDHLHQPMSRLPRQMPGRNRVLDQTLIHHMKSFHLRQLAAGKSGESRD